MGRFKKNDCKEEPRRENVSVFPQRFSKNAPDVIAVSTIFTISSSLLPRLFKEEGLEVNYIPFFPHNDIIQKAN